MSTPARKNLAASVRQRLFEHLLSGRVKSIRAGEYEACRVDKITAHDSV